MADGKCWTDADWRRFLGSLRWPDAPEPELLTCRCKCHITDFGPCDECDAPTVWYPGADSEDLDDLYSGRKDIGMPEESR